MTVIKPESFASILPSNWQEKLLYPAFNPKRSALEHKIHLVGLVIAGSLLTLFTCGIGFILVHSIHRKYTAYQKKANDLTARVDDFASGTSPLNKTLEKSITAWAGKDVNRLIAKNSILGVHETKHFSLTLSNLDEIPKVLCQLTYLKDLSFERIGNLNVPKELHLLKRLSITNCTIDPEFDWAPFTSLEKLKISGCGLLKIPEKIFNFIQLEKLDLSHNQLRELPSNITRFVKLEELDLSHNQLRELPSNITRFVKLEELDLSHNQLQALPPKMSSLRKLELSNNKITSIAEFKPSGALVFLNLNGNQIKELSLKDLQWAGNDPLRIEAKYTVHDCWINKKPSLSLSKLDEIPEINHLIHLKKLNFANIKNLKTFDKLSTLTNLEELDLSGCSFDPEFDWGVFISLKKLFVTNGELTEIPEQIYSLTTLEGLDLNFNHLTQISSKIRGLTHLKTLEIGSNHLSSIPSEVGFLTALTYLNFQSNQLTAVTSEIFNLIHLQTLIISSNQLTSINPGISSLTKLESMDLSDNLLTDLPAEMQALDQLRDLNLERNQFREVPAVLDSLKDLTDLDMSHNPLKTILPLHSYFEEAGKGLTTILYKHCFAQNLEKIISNQPLQVQDAWLKTWEDNPDQPNDDLRSFLKKNRYNFKVNFDAIFNKLIENWIENPKTISKNYPFTSKSIVWLKLALDMVKIINFPENTNSDERENLYKTTLDRLSKLQESPLFAKFALKYSIQKTRFESEALAKIYKLMVSFSVRQFILKDTL